MQQGPEAGSFRIGKQSRFLTAEAVRNYVGAWGGLLQTAGYGGHQQHFVPVLECVARTAEEADVFFVHVNIQKTTDLAGIISQMRLEVGKFFVESREELVQVRRSTRNFGSASGVAAEGSGNLDSDVHRLS
jgi:hypothetical protein